MLVFVFKKYAGFYTLIFVLGVLNNSPFYIYIYIYMSPDFCHVKGCMFLVTVVEGNRCPGMDVGMWSMGVEEY